MSAIDDPKDDPPASPFVYLGRDPTPEEHQLAQQVGLHDGASVPFHMFAKVCVRLYRYSVSAAGIEWFWRRARRYARTSLGALASTVVVIGGFVLHRVAAEAAAQEHAAAEERAEVVYREGVTRQLDAMERQLAELRSALMRLGVNLPAPQGPTSDMPELQEKVSSLAPDERIERNRGTHATVAKLAETEGLAAFGVAAADDAAPVGVDTAVQEWLGGLLAGPQCHAQDDSDDFAHASVVHQAGASALLAVRALCE